MVYPHPRLLIIAAVISFCSNWQFAFQITYVNTSVKTFYQLANEGFRAARGCKYCWLPEQSWSSAWSTIVSSVYPGTIFGFLMIPALTARFGVKRSQIGMCLSAILGCFVHFLAQIWVNQGEGVVSAVLIFGRFVIGIQAGSSLCLLPLYIIEISPRHHRAFLSTFQQVSQALGTLLGLLLGSEEFIPLGEKRFMLLQVFAVTPTLVFVLVLIFTPKTPHQLLKDKVDITKVIESISFYHCLPTSIDEIKRECIVEEENANEKLIYSNSGISWATWKGFLIGSAAAISYAFTADDLIDTFSALILTNAGDTTSTKSSVTEESSDIISVVMGAILLISSLFGTVLIDRFGRRRLLLIGLFGSALSNAVVVAFPSSPFLVTTGFSLTKAFIGLGAGAPAWFLTSELVSAAHVSLFQSLSTGFLLISTMLVTFFYLQLNFIIGNYSIFILSSGPAFILAIILYFFLPETKGKTTTEVQSLLTNRTLSGLASRKNRRSSIYGTL